MAKQLTLRRLSWLSVGGQLVLMLATFLVLPGMERQVLVGAESDRAPRYKTGDRFVGHRGTISEILFTPDGKQVITSGLDTTIRIWDRDTGRQLRMLSHDRWVCGLPLSPDGKRILSSSLDDTVCLWDLRSGERVFKLNGHRTSGGPRYIDVGFHLDRRRFLSFGTDMYLRMWDFRTGKLLAEHAIRPSRIPMKKSKDGRLTYTGGRYEGRDVVVRHAAKFTPDGKRMLLSGSIQIEVLGAIDYHHLCLRHGIWRRDRDAASG